MEKKEGNNQFVEELYKTCVSDHKRVNFFYE